jgi:hypothetical protein
MGAGEVVRGRDTARQDANAGPGRTPEQERQDGHPKSRQRGEDSGQANLVEGGFVTDATHTGGVAILGKEGDNLIGRFSFELVSGDGELSFDDGVFNVPQR